MLGSHIKALAERYLDHCAILDERYRILHKLGEGRYGKVYLALDTHTTNLIAIKILRGACFRTQLVHFFNEIRHLVFLLGCISCEKELRATKILDFSFAGRLNNNKAVAYYTMEYIELGELYSLIEKSEHLSEDLACHFLRQITRSLRLLHAYKLYHLDIKPENVLVNSRGELCLCDFGNSIYCKRVKDVHWQHVSFVGSHEYAAPEAYELELSKDALYDRLHTDELGKLDVFSLGVLAFVLVVKSRPFGKASADDPYFRRLLASKSGFWDIFTGLRNVSEEFRSMVESMLEYASDERTDIEQLYDLKWLSREINKEEIEHELSTLLETRKQQFMKELIASLESRLTKRKHAMASNKLHRYKDGEEVLKKFLIAHSKKLDKLQTEMQNCKLSMGRYSPVEISSVSNHSSDDDLPA